MISSTKMCAEEVKTGFHGDNIRVFRFSFWSSVFRGLH